MKHMEEQGEGQMQDTTCLILFIEGKLIYMREPGNTKFWAPANIQDWMQCRMAAIF